MLKIGTFCSGIGSPEQALKDLGISHSVEFACEKDRYAKVTYQANHTAKLFYDDLTTIDYKTLPDVNLFVAGFPCQSFSLAGHRLGFEDTRGTIFFNILEYLKIKQPDTFILENVKGILSHDHGNTFQTIINSLAKEVNGQLLLYPNLDSLGYYVYYAVLNAKDYGIPQNRERIFIVGFKKPQNFKFPVKQVLNLKLKDLLEDNVDEKYYLSDKALQGLLNHKEKNKEAGNGFGCNILDIDTTLSNTQCITQGSIERNLIAPTIKSRYYKDGSECRIRHSEPQTLTTKRSDKAKDIRRENMKKGKDYSPFSESLLIPRTDGIAGTLYANPNPVKDNLLAIPVLTPNRIEKRQNGRRFKTDGEPMFTLTGQDLHGIYDGYRVRRLIPRECMRLMGFKDSFDISKVSDTQAYKQAGNSIVTTVLKAIYQEIFINQIVFKKAGV